MNNREQSYADIGLKCGLEIHQQLDTNKLFCNCPSSIRDDQPHFTITRSLRAIAGESGVVDQAALAEQSKNKSFIYQGYHDTTCLVELDEEPPLPMNQEALGVVLQMCKFFGSTVVDQVRVMRKTVIDGSNTTGFQRTCLVGTGGKIDEVRIDSVCLEEDACNIVSREHGKDVYNLSRLGIPLIEIATAPDITTPQQAREVAENIGMMLRSTGKVKRGIGTIRQDLNVSIKGGVRVELKGVQDLRLIPTYVEYEVMRQQQMLRIFSSLKKMRAQAEETIIDLSAIFKSSKAKVIRSSLDNQGVVLGIRMTNYQHLLGEEVQHGRRLGSEYSDHAKTQGVKGLFHADELPGYGITSKEVEAVKKKLKLGKDDSFIIIADQELLAKKALQTVIKQANNHSLVTEVRRPKPDGTSAYLRPMPGAARMYPETDIPPVNPPSLANIVLPELISQKAARYEKQYCINKDIALHLAKKSIDLDQLVTVLPKLEPSTIANAMLTWGKELKKRYDSSFSDEEHELVAVMLVLEKINEQRLPMNSALEALKLLAQQGSVDWEQFNPLSEAELDKVLKEVIASDPQAPIGALMGEAMKRLGGKANGKVVMSKLKELTGK